MADMLVRSYVTLRVPVEEHHLKTARMAAGGLTTDKSAVTVEVTQENQKEIVTTFPMKRARQIDVDDRIMHAFAMDMEDYSDQYITFPKTDAEIRRDQRKLERAKAARVAARIAKKEMRVLHGICLAGVLAILTMGVQAADCELRDGAPITCYYLKHPQNNWPWMVYANRPGAWQKGTGYGCHVAIRDIMSRLYGHKVRCDIRPCSEDLGWAQYRPITVRGV